MALRGCFNEPFPMLPLPLNEALGPIMTVSAAIIGTIAGIAGVGITYALHAIEDVFEKMPIHWTWGPAIGGLVVGILGWIDPRILGAGYDNLRAMLAGELTVMMLLSLAFYKFLAWSIYLGSGTAGGTLAPIMTIGGAIGSLVVFALFAFPGFSEVPLAIGALIGMAAIFSSVSRAFLTSVAFAFEATHSTAAFGPLLLGCACAVIVSRLMMKESMMTERLARRGVRVPEDYEPDPLRGQTVSAMMDKQPLVVDACMTVDELMKRIVANDSPWATIRLIPIVDANDTLLGVISRADVLAAAQIAPGSKVLDAGAKHPITIHPEQSLGEAADQMILHAVGRLPVVDHSSPPKLRGIISRKDVLQVRAAVLEAESRNSSVPSKPA